MRVEEEWLASDTKIVVVVAVVVVVVERGKVG